MVLTLLMLAHLVLAGAWMGAMGYSLAVVQPKVARFYPDEVKREEFLVTLADGNRWPVVALLAVLLSSGLAVIAVTSSTTVVVGYAVALGLDAVAAAVFWYVSWRHWPARVFALPEELAGFRARLRTCAISMFVLVAAGFVTAAGVSVR